MSQKTLSTMLKFIDVLMVICCCGLAFFAMPQLVSSAVDEGSAFGGLVAAVLVSVAPVVIGMLAWLIFVNIGKNESFCVQNAKYLQVISIFAVIEAFVFLAGFAFLAQSAALSFGTGVSVLAAALVCFVFAVATAALSHLTLKAALIRAENELTV